MDKLISVLVVANSSKGHQIVFRYPLILGNKIRGSRLIQMEEIFGFTEVFLKDDSIDHDISEEKTTQYLGFDLHFLGNIV